jgi:uncharacterized membrane protein YgaE (UPF0421/DUF939 family)
MNRAPRLGLPRLRRISAQEIRLGVRIALAAVLALVAARMLGLEAFYWAGISAIVVSTGTPGGSFRASLARYGGTLVGLATALLFIGILGHSLFAAAMAIPVAILVCQVVGLQASVKVAALTTLFPITVATGAHGFAVTTDIALSRAGNVVLGCLVTLMIDGVFWPEPVAAKLQERLRADVDQVGRLAAAMLGAYLAGLARGLDRLVPEPPPGP